MSKNNSESILINDYLDALGVPHTAGYSSSRFSSMPFRSLFGLKKLLEEYGVKSEGYELADKSEMLKIDPPFLSRTGGRLVIVTDIADGSVGYLSQGESQRVPADEFVAASDGKVFLSYPDADACEPDYAAHVRFNFLSRAKRWVLALCAAVLLGYLIVTNGIWHYWSAMGAVAVNMFGLYLTYLLVRKSLNIDSRAADRFCSALEAGGCDSILHTSASKFFGLFGWSEVGFSYFSVSLLTLLLFPDMLPWLALCNVCCLPFTVWSIWYQRFRARKWCTLCVCVQGSLWLLFGCYLGGGWLGMVSWPPAVGFFALGLAYVTVMLGLNAVMPLMKKSDSENK